MSRKGKKLKEYIADKPASEEDYIEYFENKNVILIESILKLINSGRSTKKFKQYNETDIKKISIIEHNSVPIFKKKEGELLEIINYIIFEEDINITIIELKKIINDDNLDFRFDLPSNENLSKQYIHNISLEFSTQEGSKIEGKVCRNCRNEEVRSYQSQKRGWDEPPTIIYICTKCGYNV